MMTHIWQFVMLLATTVTVYSVDNINVENRVAAERNQFEIIDKHWLRNDAAADSQTEVRQVASLKTARIESTSSVVIGVSDDANGIHDRLGKVKVPVSVTYASATVRRLYTTYSKLTASIEDAAVSLTRTEMNAVPGSSSNNNSVLPNEVGTYRRNSLTKQEVTVRSRMFYTPVPPETTTCQTYDRKQNSVARCRTIVLEIKVATTLTDDDAISDLFDLLHGIYEKKGAEGVLDSLRTQSDLRNLTSASNGMLLRLISRMKFMSKSLIEWILGFDGSKVSEDDFGVVPRSFWCHLPSKAFSNIETKYLINLIKHHDSPDIAEHILSSLLIEKPTDVHITRLFESMKLSRRLCRFVAENILTSIEDFFQKASSESFQKFENCLKFYLPESVLRRRFGRSTLQKTLQGFDQTFADDEPKLSLRKWLKISRGFNFASRHRFVLTAMTCKELNRLPLQSLSFLSLLNAKPSFPKGFCLLDKLIQFARLEGNDDYKKSIYPQLKTIPLYITVNVIRNLTYDEFRYVWEAAASDPHASDVIPYAVVSAMFSRVSLRPLFVAGANLPKLGHLIFALSFDECSNLDIGKITIYSLRYFEEVEGMKRSCVRRFATDLSDLIVGDTVDSWTVNDAVNLDLVDLLPRSLLPGLPYKIFERFNAVSIVKRLKDFSRVSGNLNLVQRVRILQQIRGNLWSFMDDVMSGDGPESLIPLLPPKVLRYRLPSFLTLKRENSELEDSIYRLPPHILRMWLGRYRHKYLPDGWTYSTLAWMRSGILGLSCPDLTKLPLEDLLGVLQLYQHHNSKLKSTWKTPSSLCKCIRRKFNEYKIATARPSTERSPDLLTTLTASEATLLGGEVLTHFSVNELRSVSSRVCPLVFKLIGGLPDTVLLLSQPLEKLMKLAILALDCEAKQSDDAVDERRERNIIPDEAIEILGKLLFHLPPFLLDFVAPSSFREFLIAFQSPFHVCLDLEQQVIVAEKIVETFGEPCSWDQEDLYMLSSLLYVFDEERLNNLSSDVLQDMANFIIKNGPYQTFVQTSAKYSRKTSYGEVCESQLPEDERSSYSERNVGILRLGKVGILHSLHIGEGYPLTCEGIRSVGLAATTFTREELLSLSVLELSRCLEDVGRWEWDLNTTYFIWDRIKQAVTIDNHTTTDEYVIQANSLTVAMQPDEFDGLSFEFPNHLEMVVTLGQQTRWTQEQLSFLAQKWIEDNHFDGTLRLEQVAALNSIICGMPLDALRLTSRVLRYSVYILSKLEHCSTDRKEYLAGLLVRHNTLGRPSIWDENMRHIVGTLTEVNLTVVTLRKTPNKLEVEYIKLNPSSSAASYETSFTIIIILINLGQIINKTY